VTAAGHGCKRAQQEDAAIVALLTEPTIAAAAEKVGIGERTPVRWLSEPTFRAQYRAARRQLVEAATGRLQQAATQAVDALTRNLTWGVPPSEIAAAKAILDQAIKAIELVDLAERIEQLEQVAAAAAERSSR
jgi:hypothetical protein